MATPTTFDASLLKQMADEIMRCSAPPSGRLFMPQAMRTALVAECDQLHAPRGNPLFAGLTETTFMGLPVEVADIPPQITYDWSGCRSPARAKRRHARGFPQRVKITKRDVAYLVDKAAMRMRAAMERDFVKMIYGGTTP